MNRQIVSIVTCITLLSSTCIAAGKKKPSLPNTSPSPSVVPSPSPSPTKKVSCNAVIKACDGALQKKDQEIQQDKKIITEVQTDNANLTKKAKDDEQKVKSPFRNPFLMAGVGAGVGLAVGGPIAMAVGLVGGIIWLLVAK